MAKRDKQYIGDGAFVEFDGFAFILSAPREREQEDYVVLEPSELGAFLKYVDKAWPGLIAELTNAPK